MQAEANSITGEMNRLSANISEVVQSVALDGFEEEEAQGWLDMANGRMAEYRSRLERTWEQMDYLKVRAAKDEVAARILRGAGLVMGLIALSLVSDRWQELAPYCLLGGAMILGFSVIP